MNKERGQEIKESEKKAGEKEWERGKRWVK